MMETDLPEPLINLHDWLIIRGYKIVTNSGEHVSRAAVQRLYARLEADALERAREETERHLKVSGQWKYFQGGEDDRSGD